MWYETKTLVCTINIVAILFDCFRDKNIVL